MKTPTIFHLIGVLTLFFCGGLLTPPIAEAAPKKVQLEKGMTIPITAFMTVKVMNPDGVQESYRTFALGETCYIDNGSSATLVGTKGKRALLRFIRPESSTSSCPTETLFLIPIWQVKAFLRTDTARKATTERRRRLVDSILSEE